MSKVHRQFCNYLNISWCSFDMAGRWVRNVERVAYHWKKVTCLRCLKLKGKKIGYK